ncbi:chemotaxis-specific protein-glutamate methyltransferase CheB [Halobium salinum]|uniref:Protein-glutamate methylesterase/protein-glutamine glutaminase n=1 Tax=Halobium salinum TaxID=1364940 RepID=A0ABD5P7M1_9EURY
MRGLIGDVLAEGGVEVVGEAADGSDAVRVVAEHRPDVVTMDLEMPEMNGIDAVEAVMAEVPTPILMLSAHTEDGAEVTFEALDRGAVDFFTKPGGEISTGVSRRKAQLVEKVREVATADVSTPLARSSAGVDGPSGSRAGPGGRRTPAVGSSSPAGPTDGGGTDTRQAGSASVSNSTAGPTTDAYVANPTLVVGASTGGPNAVERVLSELPRAADFRVLVVQHMPAAFTRRFAERLDAKSDYDVYEATDGARIGGGEALVAEGDTNTLVSGYANGRLRVRLTDEDYDKGVQPSVDVTMESAAEAVTGPLVGAVLTGMGADGAAGIRAMSRAGGHTLAESEESATIYGMPKRAIATGAVDDVRPIDAVASGICDAVRDGTR